MTEISTIYIMISRKQYWYNSNDRYLWLEIMVDNYGWFIVDYGWFIVDYGWLTPNFTFLHPDSAPCSPHLQNSGSPKEVHHDLRGRSNWVAVIIFHHRWINFSNLGWILMIYSTNMSKFCQIVLNYFLKVDEPGSDYVFHVEHLNLIWISFSMLKEPKCKNLLRKSHFVLIWIPWSLVQNPDVYWSNPNGAWFCCFSNPLYS